MNMVGFARRSLYEMEQLWNGIRLFYFTEGGPFEEGDYARLWLKPDPACVDRIVDALKLAFPGRWSSNHYYPGVSVDGRVALSIMRSDDFYRIKVTMEVREDWQPADFDRLREIDRILDKLDLPIEPIPAIGRSFFQGKVIE